MFSKDEKKGVEDVSNISNIIGKETVLQGDLASAGNIRVEGRVVGDVKAKAKFVLGKDAEIVGSVVASMAEISGTITGNIEVVQVLTLKPSAVIQGDILTNQLVIEPGASFNGNCKMGHLAKEIKVELPESAKQKAFKRA